MLTKPRDRVQWLETSLYSPKRRRRFSPLMLIGVTVTVLVSLIGVGAFVVWPLVGSYAATTPNMDCTLIVPNSPLSAHGLATPYQLVATNPANGPCNEVNADQSAFVQAAIIDPATGKVSIYEPLVIDQGTTPAVTPVVPQLPAKAVVGIWFGDNGNVLTLMRKHARRAAQGHQAGQGNKVAQANTTVPANTAGQGAVAAPQANIQTHRVRLGFRGGLNGRCVNGTPGSPFGQFGYCNAPAFFQAANAAIQRGQLTIPPLGTRTDGLPCPTARSFSIVDMDQSDNVQTVYLANAQGQTAQFSAANQAKMPNATVLKNPSDNALLSNIVDPALGCTPWKAPDLVDNNYLVPALPLDELQAAAQQQAPMALVPLGDPMTLINAATSLTKTNLYRIGVDQKPAATAADASTTTYCQNLVKVGLPRLQGDMALFKKQASPDPATADSLFTFLANRLNGTFSADGLNCIGLLNIANPVTLTTDGNDVVTAATIATTPAAGTGPTNGMTQ